MAAKCPDLTFPRTLTNSSTLSLFLQLQYNEVFVLCIGIGLILLTIAFEEGKEYLEDSVTEDMEPIVEKLFGEMTVLGFLSMVTFLFSEFGFFEFLSVRMFGVADEEEELLEITEVVHFGIFFIMVVFFIQVLVLIRQALKTEALWRQLDREIRFPETALHSLSSSTLGQPSADKFNDDEDNLWIHSFGPLIRFWRNLRLSNSFISLFPYFRNEEEELKVNRMYFRALRQEFILERSIDPPFEPLPPNQQIDPSFSFGRYLGLCLVKFLANVVEVGAVTLVLFLVGDVMYFAYCRLVQERLLVGASRPLMQTIVQPFSFTFVLCHRQWPLVGFSLVGSSFCPMSILRSMSWT